MTWWTVFWAYAKGRRAGGFKDLLAVRAFSCLPSRQPNHRIFVDNPMGDRTSPRAGQPFCS